MSSDWQRGIGQIIGQKRSNAIIPKLMPPAINAVHFVSFHLQMNRALVYIEQEGQVTGVTFPSTPIVVSLLDYDNIDGAQRYPPRGYPLVCVTVSFGLKLWQYGINNKAAIVL